MPRRPKAVAPGISSPLTLTTAANTSPAASSGTTLVQALADLPPKLELSDDDLTPPPAEQHSKEVEEAVEEAVDAVMEQAAKTKRRRGKVSYVEAEGEGDEPVEPEEPIEAPKKGRARKSRKVVEADDASVKEEEGLEEDGVAGPAVTPKKGRKKVKADADVDGDGEATPNEKKPRKPTPKKSRLAKDEPEYDSEGNEIVKKKRKPKVYAKIEYDIPDVERKVTTFRGRLGYACLNTVLRSTKPDSIFCSRTCRIASIEEEGMELPKGLALMNVRDLKTMIEWNEQNKIRFMRLSSEMFPFASHAKYGYDLSFAAEGLKEAGDLAKKYGHRLTMHPGQFTQLGSPKDNVVTASIRELDYQCEILDRMGVDQDGVMIIHMGGIYGDKPSTLQRFKENFQRLDPKVKARLVLENDEICYNVDDLLPLCNELEIPIIFDYHHDWINPSSEPPSVLIPKIAETWKKRGIKMKQHLSEPRPGAESVMEKRAHADRCKALPPDLPDDADLMIEAKDKEQAVFELYRIYGLEDVIHDNLRPPDPAPGLHTKGRKSATKKKVKDTGEVDEDGNPLMLSDVEKEGDGGLGDESVDAGRVENDLDHVKEEVAAKEQLEGMEGVLTNGKSETKGKGRKRAKKGEAKELEERAKGAQIAAAEPEVKAEGEAIASGEKPPPKKRTKRAKEPVVEMSSTELADEIAAVTAAAAASIEAKLAPAPKKGRPKKTQTL